LIEVEGLTRYYGDNAAVRGVSFTVERGEIVGFLGPNGAGKTTTMRMLTCFLPPSSGTARVAGFDIRDQSREVRSCVGYLPESVPLYRDLSVDTYLDFVARLKGMSRPRRIREVAGIMEQCGIDEVQRKRIGALSRGYRQRVGIAQALIGNPKVLILDEPTVGLDPRQIIEIRDLIRNLAGERTVILSTHILPEVSLLCHRVLIINRGQLVGDDTVANLGASLDERLRVDIAIRGETESARRALDAVAGVASITDTGTDGSVCRFRLESESGVDIRDAVSAAVVGAGLGLVSLGSREMSLEDIFVRLVAGEALPHE
jgi:ABC-2 type transport system ATP-binding protein